MKTIKYAAILVGSIFIFNACTKDVAGPAGPTGVQGPQGPAASYNVTIDSVMPAQWPSSPNGPNNSFTFTINNIKALTNPDFNIVEVYATGIYNTYSTWQELSAANVLTIGDALTCSFTTYQVTLEYTNPNNTAPVTPLFLKIVIINQP